MALKDLMAIDTQKNSFKKEGISEERLLKILDDLRNLIAFFRLYPDLFIDFVKGPDCKFEFHLYQRVVLRAAARHKHFYGCFPRGFSKSFLCIMQLMDDCILYPGADMFVTSGGKEQAASITLQKVEEICRLIPSLINELDLERGRTKINKDNIAYKFKNGSKLGNLAATERTRGQRRTGGLMEEVILIDQTMLQEVIIPVTVAAERILPNGEKAKDEIVSHSERYITTAGYRDSFAYKKLRDLLIESVCEPDTCMILGGTYEIPLKEGLLDENFLEDLKMQETYTDESFEREMESHWSGSSEGAFFSSQMLDKRRIVKTADTRYNPRSMKQCSYVAGVDVGRLACTTEAVIIRRNRREQGVDNKAVTNIFTFEAEHFEDQAIHLKRLYYQYNLDCMVIDGNGLGIGLIDFMVKSNYDAETGETYPPFGVRNDEDGVYKKYKTPDTEDNAIWIMKANAPLNTEMYSYCKTQFFSGRVNLLIDESAARTELMKTTVGKSMRSTEVADYLRPYVLTTVLKDQMCNLIEKNEGQNILLERINRTTKQDKFSALIYGLYYCHLDEEKRMKKGKRDLKGLMLFN